MENNVERELPLSQRLIDAIKSFPTRKAVTHCGTTFYVNPFGIYATCPHCATTVKIRSFAAVTELEDVFDAVFEWMNQPGVLPFVRERQEAIKQDADDT